MKILLLGYSDRVIIEHKKIERAFKKRGHEVNYVLWGELLFSFSQKGVSIKRRGGKDLKYYDYILPRSPSAPRFGKKSRLRTNRLYRHFLLVVDYINQHHKHILNERVARKMHFYDKLSQHFILAKNGLPIVPSLVYTGKTLPSSVYKKYKYPYIVKSIEGSQGKQVFLINKSSEEIPKLLEEYGLGNLIIQKYLPTKHDYRIIVIGNQVIGGVKRIAQGKEFRTNVHRGGLVEKIKISNEFKKLALKAARVFNAEFAGVDIIEYKGRPYILEVNIFSGFEGFEAATGINVAEKLVAYIEKKYLWSIDVNFSKKERLKMLDELCGVEKENLEPSFTKKRLREHLGEKDLIVVKKEHKPIAYLTHYKKGKTRYVSRLVILPEYRGQRIGRRMLRELIAIGKKEKDQKIQETVMSTNKKRQQSFLRTGFKKKKTIKNRFEKGVHGIVFEYKIPPSKKVGGQDFQTEAGV